MNCSVPANETISATVTITNAVGVTASKSASAGLLATCTPVKLQKRHLLFNPLDVLAQACQMQSVLTICYPGYLPLLPCRIEQSSKSIITSWNSSCCHGCP